MGRLRIHKSVLKKSKATGRRTLSFTLLVSGTTVMQISAKAFQMQAMEYAKY